MSASGIKFKGVVKSTHLATADHGSQYLGGRDCCCCCLLFTSPYEGDILQVFTDVSFPDHKLDQKYSHGFFVKLFRTPIAR